MIALQIVTIQIQSTLDFTMSSNGPHTLHNWFTSDLRLHIYLTRGLTEENTRLGIISPVGYLKSQI